MPRVRCESALLVAIMLSVQVPIASAQHFDSTITRVVAPGVVHRRLVVNSTPWTINVVSVDLRHAGARLIVAPATDSSRGRTTVPDIARHYAAQGDRVLAAINADFFHTSTGEVVNNEVIGGEIWHALRVTDSPYDPVHAVHSQLAITASGRPVIEQFALDGNVIDGAGHLTPIAAINFPAETAGVVLFTSRIGATTPRDSGTRHVVELPLLRTGEHFDTVLYRVAGPARPGGGTPINHGAVLSVRAPFARLLARLSDTGIVRVVTALRPSRGALASLTGGWPRLVAHGRSITDSIERLEGVTDSFSLQRHPRTGFGVSRDSGTVYLVVVDGRQKSSAGMSLPEFANLMVTLGIYDGINFDGGGSTTMLVNGAIVNHPSDSVGVRAVANALLVVVPRRP